MNLRVETHEYRSEEGNCEDLQRLRKPDLRHRFGLEWDLA